MPQIAQGRSKERPAIWAALFVEGPIILLKTVP
jgi:hypothetical protein